MTYQRRGRHSWFAAGGTLVATVAITAGSLAASGAPAFARGRPRPPAPTTSTTDPTTSTSTTSTTVAATTSTTSAPSGNLSKAQSWGQWLIKTRVDALTRGIKQVQGDNYLGSDGTTLISDIQADITGLQALGTTIAAATSLNEVNADNTSIFTSYQVYNFLLPMVHDVVQADWVSNVGLPDIAKALTKLQSKENAGNQSVLGPLFSNIQHQQQTATGAVSGLSGELLGYTVVEWGSNHGLLNSPGANILIADKAVRTAEKDCSRAYDYLRWFQSHGGGTTTTSTIAPTTTTTTVAPTTTTTAAAKGGHGRGFPGRGFRGRGGPGCRRHVLRCPPRPHRPGHPGTPPSTTTTSTTAPTTTTTVAPTTTTTVVTTTTTAAPGTKCFAGVIGTVLSRTGWVASSNAPSSSSDAAANALDGNLKTRFSSDEDQKPGLYFELNLGTVATFDELLMDVPNSPHDYARGYEIEVSNNGTSWTTVATCAGNGTTEIVSFPSQKAQYVKVVLTASNSSWWWSIDEFYLNG